MSTTPSTTTPAAKTRNLGDVLQEFRQHRQLMQRELQKIIIGQDAVIEQIFAAIFTRGHCLLVGVPGLAKTLIVSTLACVKIPPRRVPVSATLRKSGPSMPGMP